MFRILWLLVVGGSLVARAGEVSGRVHFEGNVPAPSPAVVPKEHRAVCGSEVPDETVRVTNGALANVVVWLDLPARPTPSREVQVDIAQCRMHPRVLAVPVGTTLAIHNADRTNHSVHARLDGESLFHVALPIPGQTIRRTLVKPGLVELRCSAGHAWEKAWLRVMPHPFATVTGSDGTFRLEDVPDGPVTLVAWHETFGERRLELKVAGPTRAEVTFRQ